MIAPTTGSSDILSPGKILSVIGLCFGVGLALGTLGHQNTGAIYVQLVSTAFGTDAVDLP